MPKKLSNVLTPLAVKNAKPGRHADGGGLHLLVKESGSRSWVYRFMLHGKSRDIGVGQPRGLMQFRWLLRVILRRHCVSGSRLALIRFPSG